VPRRRSRRWHPDFDAGSPPRADVALADPAVDFVDMARVVDRAHAAFVKLWPRG
jgi:hypothetical protein